MASFLSQIVALNSQPSFIRKGNDLTSHSSELNSSFGDTLQSSVNNMSNTLDPSEVGGKFLLKNTQVFKRNGQV